LHKHEPGPDNKSSCQALLSTLPFNHNDPAARLYQFGTTKIFLKTGIVSYLLLFLI